MAAYAITATELIASLGADADSCHRAWIAGNAAGGEGDFSIVGDLPTLPEPWQGRADRSLGLLSLLLSRLSVPLSAASRRWGPGKLGIVVGVQGPSDGRPALDDDLVELARRHSRARGPAYAITGDIAAGGWAIRSATDLLSSGLCDGVLVVGIGGDVGSRTKFWQELGELGSPGSYPLRGDRTGLRLGEGAAAILLERQGRCEVELRGSASSDDAAQAIRDALELAGASPRQLTWALCGADGRVEADRRLAEAIRRELGTTLPVASAVACRGSLGAAQDVAGIVDVVRSVDAGRIGPLGPSQPSDPWFGLNVVCEPTALETDLALTIHAGIDGAFNAFVLGVREP